MKRIYINERTGDIIPPFYFIMARKADPESAKEYTAFPYYLFADLNNGELISTGHLFREWQAMTEEERDGDSFRDYLRRVVSDTMRGQNDLTMIVG